MWFLVFVCDVTPRVHWFYVKRTDAYGDDVTRLNSVVSVKQFIIKKCLKKQNTSLNTRTGC